MGRADLIVLRALGLGDLLTAVPALRGLARAFPTHRRLLVAPAPLSTLLPLIEFEEGRCIEGTIDLRALDDGPRWLPDDADVAVDLHGRGPQSHRLLLARRPRRLVAFANPDVPESAAMPAWDPDEHEVERWCRLLRESGIPCDPRDLSIRRPERILPPQALGATLIHPGAAGAARRWPADRWAVVARAEREAGRQVFLTGTAGERGLCAEVAAAAGLDLERVLAGQTDLRRLAALVGAADVLACGDTGVAHLASALGTRSVVLFGPTSPCHWGPPPLPIHRSLWAGQEGDPHGERVDPGLLEIEAERVVAELAGLRHVGALA